MATGGVFLTEDDLSCEICFNLYTDPKTLKCLHTFCGGCISQLAGNRNMVECPNCREKTNMADVRKDFRIQKLLDQHLGQVTGTCTPSGHECGMCKKKGQFLQMYCVDCDKLICNMCCRIHAETKDIANHTIIPEADLIKNYKSELQTKLDLLQTLETDISTYVKGLESDISRIQGEQDNLIKKVDSEIDNVMHQLKKIRLELHKKIENSNKNMIESLQMSKVKCMKEKTDICTNITQIRGVMDKDDIFLLKNSNSLINVSQTRLTVQKRINFDTFPSVKVVAGSWRPHDIVKVVSTVDNEITGCSAVRNKVHADDHKLPDFSVVRNNEYVKCKSINSYIYRIQIIDENLYCACGHNGIQVYNKNCDFIKSITSYEFCDVTGVADCGTEELIVSGLGDNNEDIPGGLHQVTLQGTYVTCVTEGDFNDVCVYNGIVSGLKSRDIHQFQLKNSEWVKVGEIDLETLYDYDDAKSICINSEGIFISIYNLGPMTNTLWVYNHETKAIQELANKPQSNWDLGVCSADSHSNLLVVERESETVCVYYKDDSKWHEVLSVRDGRSKYIHDAVVDESGNNIWVVTANKLIKYTKK